MLSISRALLLNPKLILLDEPSQGLAPLIVQEVFRVITAARKEGISVLLVEQNVRAAVEIADRAYVLDSGEVVYSGGAAEFAKDEERVRAPRGRKRRELGNVRVDGAMNRQSGISQIGGRGPTRKAGLIPARHQKKRADLFSRLAKQTVSRYQTQQRDRRHDPPSALKSRDPFGRRSRQAQHGHKDRNTDCKCGLTDHVDDAGTGRERRRWQCRRSDAHQRGKCQSNSNSSRQHAGDDQRGVRLQSGVRWPTTSVPTRIAQSRR